MLSLRCAVFISIQVLVLVKAPLEAITASSFLGNDPFFQGFLPFFSAESFKLSRVGMRVLVLGRFQVSRAAPGIRSGLCLQNSRIFSVIQSNSCVFSVMCFVSMSSWNINLLLSLVSWALWKRFSLGIILYLFRRVSCSLCHRKNIPTARCCLTTTLSDCIDGINKVILPTRLSPHMAMGAMVEQFNFYFIRAEDFSCYSPRAQSAAFWQTTSGLSCTC